MWNEDEDEDEDDGPVNITRALRGSAYRGLRDSILEPLSVLRFLSRFLL
jgi:hypothetical protein